MDNLNLNRSTIIIDAELREKLKTLSIEERTKIINENIELVRTSAGLEMLTLLLLVIDDEIVSMKEAPDDEKQKIADAQFETLSKNMKDKKFNRTLHKQTREALKLKRDELIKQGKTAILKRNNTIQVLNIPYYEYLTLSYGPINLFIGYTIIGLYTASDDIGKILGIVASMTTLIVISLISSCIYRLLFEPEVEEKDESK